MPPLMHEIPAGQVSVYLLMNLRSICHVVKDRQYSFPIV